MTDKFFWAQWDSQYQRLYLVYPEYKVYSMTISFSVEINPSEKKLTIIIQLRRVLCTY